MLFHFVQAERYVCILCVLINFFPFAQDMVSKKKKSRPTATEIVDRTQKLLFPPIYRASSNFGARSLRAYGSTPNSIGAGYLSWSPQTTRVKKQTDVEKKKGKEMEVNEKRDA
tara:strand:+ start:372 stop:710 length:339 start_codon:yes stop_codon:yes gene_type:complete